jgi:tRNA(Ile)-lysidine synthase
MVSLKKTEARFSTDQLLHILTQQCRIEAGATLKLALSGGVDSMALLHALSRLGKKQQWHISVIHVDHGLHPQSSQWSQHCLEQCRKLGIDCRVEKVKVDKQSKEGLEAAARRARYTALRQHVHSGEYLLTGHHADDQAETLLLQLMRGSGVHGLAGMPMQKRWAGALLLRPLLHVRRAALQQYAKKHKLQWIDDPSNTELRFSRNYLRQEVMPLLQQHWPQANELLLRTAAHAADAVALLDALAATDFRYCQLLDRSGLCISELLGLSRQRMRYVLRYWFRQNELNYPSKRRIEELTRFLQHKPESNQAQLRWDHVRVCRYRDRLVVFRQDREADPNLVLPWQPEGPSVDVPGTSWLLSAVRVVGRGLALEELKKAVVSVRLRRGGEQCRLPGRQHRSQLKKLLQQAEIPPWERANLPLIYVGDELAAVADLWVCAPFQAKKGEPGVLPVLRRSN